MAAEKTLTFYLENKMLGPAKAGRINVINRISAAVASRGVKTAFRLDSDENLIRSASDPGWSLFHMSAPFHDRALCLRRAYFYPFWHIENTSRRWENSIARAPFHADEQPEEAARAFCDGWRRRLFEGKAEAATRDGYVFVPLQGRLLVRRSFQSMSPLEMLRTTHEQLPERQIRITLHPNERYSAQETEALARLLAQSPRYELYNGPGEILLRHCDLVVTENSSMALRGFFLHKPAVLFAAIDFHHVAANVRTMGAAAAFRQARTAEVPFDAYLFWFLARMSINAGREDAQRRILDAMRKGGWRI